MELLWGLEDLTSVLGASTSSLTILPLKESAMDWLLFRLLRLPSACHPLAPLPPLALQAGGRRWKRWKRWRRWKRGRRHASTGKSFPLAALASKQCRHCKRVASGGSRASGWQARQAEDQLGHLAMAYYFLEGHVTRDT
jgi:hypothetical protein